MNKTERLLNEEVELLMPDILNQILDTPIIPMKEHDFITRQTPPVNKPSFYEKCMDLYSKIALRPAFSLTICLFIIIILSGSMFVGANYFKTDSVVAIDVNPSIELTTNKKNKVTKVVAKNKDADKILDNMDLIHVDLNIAVNAIIGSMLKHGYLQEDNNIILVSVSNKKEKKALQIQDEIENDFSDSLKVVNKRAIVIKQKLDKNKDREDLSKQYHISVGKLQFINQLLEADDNLSINVLAKMSMNELAEMAEDYGIIIKQNKNDTYSPHSDVSPYHKETFDNDSEDSDSGSEDSDSDSEDTYDDENDSYIYDFEEDASDKNESKHSSDQNTPDVASDTTESPSAYEPDDNDEEYYEDEENELDTSEQKPNIQNSKDSDLPGKILDNDEYAE